MKEVAISEFKAKCLAILEEVQKTRKPIRVTRFGKPVAEVIPRSPGGATGRRLGSMVGTGKIIGMVQRRRSLGLALETSPSLRVLAA
ncbi:MAG TPA: type II toxin-antitoxin system Phd/YefM family antitoxin [Candidatus Sulfotelmatobacter sp.]|jgi:prevent-host-death family protein